MYNVFDSYHPVSALVYFCAVIVFPMVFMHPLLLSLSAIAAVAYAIFLCGWRKMWKRLVVGVVFMAFIVFVNVLFNHRGLQYYATWGTIRLRWSRFCMARAAH